VVAPGVLVEQLNFALDADIGERPDHAQHRQQEEKPQLPSQFHWCAALVVPLSDGACPK
jgi:hypothetical protein